ncbi:hypothetical protein V8J88_01130 [Massilia sp. W12]|uniref:hypothetical protein n=1 Tax=Massilia sp. W12 TaxID=3126507 RepID=UPI0030CD26FA
MKSKFLLALAALLPGFSQAINLDDSGSLTLTGFYSLTAGKVLSGTAQGSSTPWTYQNWKCPCMMQNWEYTGVYQKEKGWQLDQESLLGVQIKKEFSPNFSFTTQLVTRALNPNRGSKPTIDWAYFSWNPWPEQPITIQAGRFRIPLYYYSDYLYIGYAYPWVRPAPDVYGWPIYAYDGVNIGYKTQLGKSDWSLAAQLWYGGFTQRNNAYDTLIYYTTPTHEKWKQITGGWVTLNNGVLELRAMLMKHRATVWQEDASGAKTYLLNNQFTRIAGLAANLDYNNWIVKSEFDRFEQINPEAGIRNIYKYALLGVGYNYGNWTPMFTMSRYTTVTEPIEARSSKYFSLRWDFRKDTALKIQYDITKDKSHYPYPFFGDARMLSVSLQGVF